jgi:hypothetical protein
MTEWNAVKNTKGTPPDSKETTRNKNSSGESGPHLKVLLRWGCRRSHTNKERNEPGLAKTSKAKQTPTFGKSSASDLRWWPAEFKAPAKSQSFARAPQPWFGSKESEVSKSGSGNERVREWRYCKLALKFPGSGPQTSSGLVVSTQ